MAEVELKEGAGPVVQSMDITQLESLKISQTKHGCCYELLCCECESRYKISTLEKDKVIMFAKEESNICCRICCGSFRPLDLDIYKGKDMDGEKLVTYERPLRCSAGFPCFQQTMTGFALNGKQKTKVSSARIPCYCCRPTIRTYDIEGENKFMIRAPNDCFACCRCCRFGTCCASCCRTIPFNVYDHGGKKVGKVEKIWGGLAKECCTDADTFTLQFPKKANEAERWGLIAAVFLLDYNFFEGDSAEGDAE